MKTNSIPLRHMLIAALAAPALMAGCTTIQTGREFNYAKFSQEARPGTTDMAQVRTVLGPPMGTGLVVEADGSMYEQWTYYYVNGNLTSPEKGRAKFLQIRFNQAGTVASYNWSGDLSGAAPVESK